MNSNTNPYLDPRIDEETRLHFKQLGYSPIKLINNGELVSVYRFLFTWALMVGIKENGCYRTRFCFLKEAEARVAYELWNGEGDPPGPWIKQKPEDRVGPNSPISYEDY